MRSTLNELRWFDRIILALLLLAMALPIAPEKHLDGEAIAKVHPILREMAQADPNLQVQVIVQGMGEELTSVVMGNDAELVGELPMINAVVARIDVGRVESLARNEAIRAVSLDAALAPSGKRCNECVDTSGLLDVYSQTIGATKLWNESGFIQGKSVTVAVVDSGVNAHDDISSRKNSRLLTTTKFNSFTRSGSDGYGHGTHVAGTIAGDGSKSKGARMGVAPGTNLVSVKVSDDRGAGTTSDLVNGLQWVLDNKETYNIRVVNISLNSSVQESYLTNPISAAVEILWFNGIVVVVSAGNNGNSNDILFPPANDPFVITVGATDDRGTVTLNDDTIPSFSAYGVTSDGFAKPDIVAPGTNIISLLSANGAELVKGHPSHRVDGFAGGKDYYFRMSGTSMATAVVSGAVALLLDAEPNLTPDQVKYRLMATANTSFPAYDATKAGAGYLDIHAAVHADTTESANSGITANQMLWTGSEPVNWNSVNWNSVNWNSVNWNSVNWNSVNWNSVNWNSVSWDDPSTLSYNIRAIETPVYSAHLYLPMVTGR